MSELRQLLALFNTQKVLPVDHKKAIAFQEVHADQGIERPLV